MFPVSELCAADSCWTLLSDVPADFGPRATKHVVTSGRQLSLLSVDIVESRCNWLLTYCCAVGHRLHEASTDAANGGLSVSAADCVHRRISVCGVVSQKMHF